MNLNKNQQCVEKILKWTNAMKDIFAELKINSLEDFENNLTCQLAISQLITNVHELLKKIEDDFHKEIPLFMQLRRRIKLSRDIASHDYESLDLDIVYKLLQSLMSDEIIKELEAALNDIGKDKRYVRNRL